MILITSFNTYLAAQVGFSISSSPVVLNGHLSFDGLVLQIKNQSRFNGECELRIFSDRFMKNHIANSKLILIQDALHSFDLSEILSTSNFPWTEVDISSVCFQLYASKQNIPLGLTCFDIFSATPAKNKSSKTDKLDKLKKHLSANLSYQLENWPAENNLQDRHLIDYSGELRIEEIPFKFQGYWQSTTDSYFDYGFANGKLFFDVNQWKEILLQKLKPKLEAGRDSLLADYPEYDAYKSKKEYIEKIVNSPSYLKDLAQSDSILYYAKQLGISNETDSEKIKSAIYDSINVVLSKIDRIDNNSINLAKDSLELQKKELQEEVSSLENLKLLIAQKETFDNLEKIRNEAEVYLATANGITNEYNAQIKSILANPAQLNKLLKNEGMANSFSSIANYFKSINIGTINPSYSELALQNSFLNGAELGLKLSQIEISGFYGKSNSRNAVYSTDSSFTNQQLFGLDLQYNSSEESNHNLFFISNIPQHKEQSLEQESILGYNSTLKVGKSQEFNLSVALYKPFEDEVEEANIFGSNAAALLAYHLRDRKSKINFTSKMEFYGPNYQDIDNSFLINNSVELYNQISFSIFKHITLGINSMFQKNGVYRERLEEKRRIFSNGLSMSFNHDKLPSVSYTYNLLENDFGKTESNGFFQAINVSKAFQLGTVSIQSFININHVSNKSSIDSLNNSLRNILLNSEIIWSKKLRTVLAYNFQEFKSNNEKEKNESLVIKFPIQFSKVNISPGIQYIDRNDKSELGFSLDALINIWDDLSIALKANSHSFYSYLGDDETIKTIYTPEIKLRLNHRF